MINNSPRSAPAASSATSNRPTARCISPSCTASPTPPKPPHHSPSAKANPTALDLLPRYTIASTSATSPPLTEDAFTAWVQDRSAGLDTIMLAPTRELVAELNRRARDSSPRPLSRRRGGASGRRQPGQCRRCDHHPPQRPPAPPHRAPTGSRTATGGPSPASVGDGDLTVRHTRSQLTGRLPVDYVPAPPTGLGYATTIHAAQGVTADTMHGLLTGQESRAAAVHHAHPRPARQPPLPAGRRRRRSTHPHPTRHGRTRTRRPRFCSRSWPATKRPSPPAPCCGSSTTQRPGFSRRSSATPTASTSQPNSSSDPRTVAELDQVDQYIPGLTDEPAWPTLRAHLLALAAETGQHPSAAPADSRQRTRPRNRRRHGRRPLLAPHQRSRLPTQVRCPGSRAFPQRCMAIPCGGPTWQSDPNCVTDLAAQVQDHACQGGARPVWAAPGSHPSTATHRRNRSVARRQRHQSPRPATNRRRRPTEIRPRTVETTPRPGYRPFHRFVRQRKI